MRLKALNDAEAERLRNKSAPDYLEGVEPPWNDGRKEIDDLYDEMMVEEFERRIASIRFSGAGKRALEDAEKARDGPGVTAVVSHNFGATYGLATTHLFTTPDQIKTFKS